MQLAFMQLRSIAAIEPNHRAAVISPVPEVTPKKGKNAIEMARTRFFPLWLIAE
jgi:hypothetical protein